jgi:transcriptional regulator with XRE-family HTH domain
VGERRHFKRGDDCRPELAALGLAIRLRRISQDDTQGQLAARVPGCLFANYLSGIERGQRNASYLVLHKLAAVLGTSLSRLIADAERLEATQGTLGSQRCHGLPTPADNS